MSVIKLALLPVYTVLVVAKMSFFALAFTLIPLVLNLDTAPYGNYQPLLVNLANLYILFGVLCVMISISSHTYFFGRKGKYNTEYRLAATAREILQVYRRAVDTLLKL